MNRPHVLLNMAMSADGKIATANRAITTFGSAYDHRLLLQRRTTVDAILCGARTIDTGPVDLTLGGKTYENQRKRLGYSAPPLRILVSGSASIRPDAKIFQTPGAPILLLTTQSAPQESLLRLKPLVHEIRAFGETRLDVTAALSWLHQAYHINRLLLEGGPTLNDAFFLQDAIDEIFITLTPFLVGGENSPTIADGQGHQRLAEANQFHLKAVRKRGEELYLHYTRPLSRNIASP